MQMGNWQPPYLSVLTVFAWSQASHKSPRLPVEIGEQKEGGKKRRSFFFKSTWHKSMTTGVSWTLDFPNVVMLTMIYF